MMSYLELIFYLLLVSLAVLGITIILSEWDEKRCRNVRNKRRKDSLIKLEGVKRYSDGKM